MIAKEVVNKCYSSIIMSGTLTPTSMYKELLGVEDCKEEIFQSPFPENNREIIIVPKTTTKFTARNETQYKNIAKELINVVENVPGNCAIFSPSYFMLEKVHKYFSIMTEKTVFTEISQLNSKERKDIEKNIGHKVISENNFLPKNKHKKRLN